MKRLAACSLAALVAAAGVLYAATDEGLATFSAQVVGLQVSARVPGFMMGPPVRDLGAMGAPVHGLVAAPPAPNGGVPLPRTNRPSGTALTVLIRSTAKTIIGFDADASRLTLMQDDKGMDLKGGPFQVTSATIGAPQIAPDGMSVLLDLRADGLPSPGATRIRAEGTAVLKLATSLEAARQENVALKPGSKITVGPVPLTITRVQPGSVFVAMTVTLTADQGLDAINDIQFLDAAGAVIKTQDAGTVTANLLGNVSGDKTISFSQPTDSATVVIKYWKDIETQQVPLKLEAGLSLQ